LLRQADDRIVRLPGPGALHLTYCTNIHPADGWDAVLTNLKRYAPALKARFSPDAPFGIGLRLSAREARELRSGARLDEFRSFLDQQGLYVAIINGFPHGAFHGTVVKAEVYAPDWRDEARVRYTLDLIEILRVLLPAGVDGGISTAPLSYKPWLAGGAPRDWDAITRNVVRIAEALWRVRRSDGKIMHLDIEPEPDCSLENTDETIAFFAERLLPSGAPLLAQALGMSDADAREVLLDHIQLCFDCCHFAVEFEDLALAVNRLRAADIRIGRVQLSSALKVRFPHDSAACADIAVGLRSFADTVYLHQVVERGAGDFRRYPDLDEALKHSEAACSKEWRIHFHVPLFTDQYDRFESTQGYVKDAIRLMLATGATRHLEIETYTWDVLPPGLKRDLLESIAREYQWVIENLDVSR
jgi:sugar phosphate isomerase/epimerase